MFYSMLIMFTLHGQNMMERTDMYQSKIYCESQLEGSIQKIREKYIDAGDISAFCLSAEELKNQSKPVVLYDKDGRPI